MSFLAVASGSLYLYFVPTCFMTVAMASLFFSSAAVCSAERIGEGILTVGKRLARETSSGEDCSEMIGCDSPRSTRLMVVGE